MSDITRDLYIKRGIILKFDLDFAGAIPDFNAALSLDPQNVEALKQRADCNYRLENYGSAINDYDEAEEVVGSSDRDIFVARAMVHRASGNYSSAIGDFTSALSSEGADTDKIFRQRGITHARLQNHLRAVDDYDRAIETNPTFGDAYRNRAASKMALQRFSEAIDDYTNALKSSSTDVRSLTRRGRCLAMLGEHSRAITDFSESIRLDPQVIDTLKDRAYSLAALGSNDEAIDDYTRIVELGDNDPDTYRRRGQCYQLTDQFESAVRDFGTVIQLDGSDYYDYIHRGSAAEMLPDMSLAITMYTAAVALDPSEALGFGLRGRCFHDLENYDLAIEDYVRAIERDEEGQYANICGKKPLGIAYSKINEYQKAIASFTDAIADNPEDEELYQLRGVLYGLEEEYELGIEDYETAAEMKRDTRRATDLVLLDVPNKIGDYEIKGLVAQGGLSRVYRAIEPAFGLEVAIRLPHEWSREDQEYTLRIETEADLLSELNHQNIVRVLSKGFHDGMPYAVMEYIASRLSIRLRQNGPMPPLACLYISEQVCDALVYLHTLGIIHSDIKPSNILINQQNEVKLTNFMLAKIANPTLEDPRLVSVSLGSVNAIRTLGATLLTHRVEGTPGYMSPEQLNFESSLDLDGRTDIYSLGASMYEMLTGIPYGQSGLTFAGYAVEVQSSVDAGSFVPNYLHVEANPIPERFQVPEKLNKIVMKALAPSRHDRFETATELRAALDDVTKLGL